MGRLSVEVSPKYATEFEHYPMIRTADQQNRKLSMYYENDSGVRSIRQVTPLRLYRSDNGFALLSAFDDKTNMVKSFRVDRMLALDLGDELPESAEDAAVRVASEALRAAAVDLDQYDTPSITPAYGDNRYRVAFYHKDGNVYFLVYLEGDRIDQAPSLHTNGGEF